MGVESVLDGSIQRAADRIRVNARLTNVADGKTLWTGTFDEKFTDVFGVQPAIGRWFRPDDLELGVVITHGVWQRLFGGRSELQVQAEPVGVP